MDYEEALSRWEAAGLLSPSQAGAIRAYEGRRGPAVVAGEAPVVEPEPQVVPEAEAPAVESARAVASEAVPAPPRPSPPLGERVARPGPQRARELPSFGLGTDFAGIDLRTLGTVLAALALLALLGNIFAVATDFLIGPGTKVAQTVEDVLHLVASVCGLVGGLRLAAYRESGRMLVYWSLGINLLATILLGGAHLKSGFTILTVACWLVLLFLTWRAHYRGRYRFF